MGLGSSKEQGAVPRVQRRRNGWRPVVVTGFTSHRAEREGRLKRRRFPCRGGHQFQHGQRDRHSEVWRVAVVFMLQAWAVLGLAIR